MKRYPWVKYLKRTAKELPYDSPIYLGNWSNGEFFHEQTVYERKVREEILRVADDKARKLNLDRREFMASAVALDEEREGLDLADHGERAYNY